MITAEKIKMLLNDPKFREVNNCNEENLQGTLKKIYAAQRQTYRGKIINQSTSKEHDQSVGQINSEIDFLLQRVNNTEKQLVLDIQKTYFEKDKIIQKHTEAENISIELVNKFRDIIQNVSYSVMEPELIEHIQDQIQQIKKLYQESIKLKNQNTEIRKRIQTKQAYLTTK